MRSGSHALVALTLAAAFAGCGKSSPANSTPLPTPAPAPVTTLVSEGSQSGLGERFLLIVPFRTNSSGTIRAIVDWTFAASTIHVFISQGTCTIEQFNGGSCRLVAASQTSTPKPRDVSVSGMPAGDYALYIGNFAGAQESVSWQVMLTTP